MANVVFITGGAGFIGSSLVKMLLPSVSKIVLFDNLHPQIHGKNASIPEYPTNVEFIRGDVTDATHLKEAIQASQPDLIYHLAAETGTGQSYDQPSRYNNVNILGTCYLIEALRQLPRGTRRVILAGSRAVYGEGAYKTTTEDTIVGPERKIENMKKGIFNPLNFDGSNLTPIHTPETLLPNPSSVYASTKLMQEYLLQQCSVGSELEIGLLRFQNVYGPGQSLKNPYTGVLSIFAAQILAGRTLNIYEDGDIVRDFIFVDDVVSSLIQMGNVEDLPHGPVNIGSGYPATIRETAEILLKALGAPENRYNITGEFRPGDVRYAVADISRAKTKIDWVPKIELKEGLTSLAEWSKSEW